MPTLLRSRTATNTCIRVSSLYLFLVAQCVLLGGGPCDPVQPPPDDSSSGSTVPDSNGTTDSQSPGSSDTTGQRLSAANLDGYWVVQRGSGSNALWGNTRIHELSVAGDELRLTIAMDDGSTPYLTLWRNQDASLSGQWLNSADERFMFPFNPVTNWQASESTDHLTLAGTLSGAESLTLYRAQTPDHACTGAWTRPSDGSAAIVVSEGTSVLISILNAAGDWPSDMCYDGTLAEALVRGTGANGFDALLFASGTRLHLRPASGGGILLEKSASQSPLNGRWIGGDRKYRGNTPERSARIVVAIDDTLYIHDAWDSRNDLIRSFRAPLLGTQYTDAAAGWAGTLAAGRISGEWTGYPGWYNSADRAVTPAAGELAGNWNSISLDLLHHELSGDIIRAYGSATLTQDGGHLQITDTYPGGNAYQVDATWTGDHFEGSWWDTARPNAKSPWRGELMAGGWYLHGKWDNGEYSFSRLPVASESTLQGGSAVVSADPYEDAAVTWQDPSGYAGTMFRRQHTIGGMTGVTPQGEVAVALDQRLRPTEVSGLGVSMTLNWSSDASSVTIDAVETDGTTSTYTVPVDLSDGAILQSISAAETQTGRSFAQLRDWIAANPGRVQAVATGQELPPDVLYTSGTVLPTRLRSVHIAADPRVQRILEANRDAAFISTSLGLAASGAVIIFTGKAAWVGGSLFAAWGVLTITMGAVVIAGILVGLFIFKYIVCKPCTLSCFFNCEPLKE